jgi:hypothetical protein
VVDEIKNGTLHAEAALVVCNNRDAEVLERAQQEGVPWVHLSGKTHPDPAAFDIGDPPSGPVTDAEGAADCGVGRPDPMLEIVDPILDYWTGGGRPAAYDPGTEGPASAEELPRRDGRRWRIHR